MGLVKERDASAINFSPDKESYRSELLAQLSRLVDFYQQWSPLLNWWVHPRRKSYGLAFKDCRLHSIVHFTISPLAVGSERKTGAQGRGGNISGSQDRSVSFSKLIYSKTTFSQQTSYTTHPPLPGWGGGGYVDLWDKRNPLVLHAPWSGSFVLLFLRASEHQLASCHSFLIAAARTYGDGRCVEYINILCDESSTIKDVASLYLFNLNLICTEEV